MGKEILTSRDIEIEKNKFYRNKTLIFLKGLNIEKYQCLARFPLVKKNYKYCIGQLYNDHKVQPLHIMLSKTSAFVKGYDGQTKWMYFLIEDDDVLEK